MMRAALASLCLFAVNAWADEIDTLCKERWGSDYVMIESCIEQQRAAKARLLGPVAGLTNDELQTGSILAFAHNDWKVRRGVPKGLEEIQAKAPTHRASAVYVECYRNAGAANLDGLMSLMKCLTASRLPEDAAN